VSNFWSDTECPKIGSRVKSAGRGFGSRRPIGREQQPTCGGPAAPVQKRSTSVRYSAKCPHSETRVSDFRPIDTTGIEAVSGEKRLTRGFQQFANVRPAQAHRLARLCLAVTGRVRGPVGRRWSRRSSAHRVRCLASARAAPNAAAPVHARASKYAHNSGPGAVSLFRNTCF